MLWVFLAISAHFVWAWVNIGDKYLVSHRIKNPYVYIVLLSLIGIISAILIPFIDFQIPNFRTFILLCLAAGANFYGGFPYIKAMQWEEPTRINVWWNLIPLISLMLGWFLFDEQLNNIQLFSFFILLVGAFIGSFHARGKSFRFSKAFLYMLVACFSFSLYAIMFHEATSGVSIMSGFIWVHMLMAAFSFTIFISSTFRKHFVEELKGFSGQTVGFVIGISFIDKLGNLFNQWALTFSSAALVFAFEGSQVIFVFLIATVLSLFFPRIVKEEIDRRNIMLKIVAVACMVVGVVVLSLGG